MSVVRHSRSEPTEWPALIAVATNAIGDNLHPDVFQPMEVALDATSRLDAERLETVRYYALGVALCSFVPIIQAPDMRASIVNTAAHNITHSRWQGASNLYGATPDDTRSQQIGDAFLPAATAAVEALAPAVRLVSDALDVDERTRLDRPAIMPKRLGDLTIAALNSTAFAAVGALFFRAGWYKLGSPRNNESRPDHTAATALEAGGLERLGLYKLAERCATLRRDEFAEDLDRYLEPGPDRTIQFVRRNMTPARQLTRSPSVLHINRLRCPALHVEGLIPYMLDFIPDIVARADELITKPGAPDSQASVE